ncbi:energy-coupling factor transporter ATP-binding protein EcfA2 [Clostridium saccharobutylicum]|uniref:AAA family ATPase n=1 Tax=Clostridium saccharobutylicum TaxID=169679 RepID=UPI001494D745|nr:energy-coupling factor transporter ATP-binding protein EcfA2 [Clostridium saccharobutylicum]NYC30859.1 energy-coupling factor transporter ATP-binding protein EcfA2 [Clostridium saccharobutylicum]
MRKLEYFGFKGFKDNEEQESLLKDNLLDSTFNELFDYIKNYLKYNKKLIYSDDTIRRFLVALQSNELVILSGPSGTGKSSIVTAVAEAIGGVAKIIPVKPSWTESEDLIGFYNPIEKSYVSTPFLDALVEAKKNENKDKLYLICLDEMNLSHVEYYFAEFLSKLEVNKENPSIELYSKEILDEVCESIEDTIQLMSGESVEISIDSIKKWCADNSKEYTELIIELKKKIRFIEKYPAIFDIPNNVRFVGTMNIDQTTKLISPKVIDRSFIIELLKFRAKVDDIKGEKVESKFIPADILKLNNKEELSKQSKEIIKELDLTNQVLELLDCDYNSRTYSHISKYLCNLEQWEIKFDKNEVLSDLIAMKILPRMNISIKNKADEKYKKWIEFKTEGYKKYSDDVKFKISKMDKGLEEDNILSFWGVY